MLWLEQIDFSEALDLQMKICDSKKRGFGKDVLLPELMIESSLRLLMFGKKTAHSSMLFMNTFFMPVKLCFKKASSKSELWAITG